MENYVSSFVDRAKEFEQNLNSAMKYYCTVDGNNKESLRRADQADFESRKGWHRQKIRSILNSLSFFDRFIAGTDPVDEPNVPNIDLSEDAAHNDFYQMRIFK